MATAARHEDTIKADRKVERHLRSIIRCYGGDLFGIAMRHHMEEYLVESLAKAAKSTLKRKNTGEVENTLQFFAKTLTDQY